MWKRALWIILPFVALLLFGMGLLLRPSREAKVLNVVETFSRQEKISFRSPHRRTVCYAVVEVAYGDSTATLTVHDRVWDPIRPGEAVRVTRDVTGKVVEYRTYNAVRLIVCSVIFGPLSLLLFIHIYKKRGRESGA